MSLDLLLGLQREPKDLTFVNMSLRALVCLPLALVFLRVGMRRSIDRASAFDTLTGIVLGSVLSRAINGSAAYWPTIGVTALIIAMHATIAQVAARSHVFSVATKGRPIVLLRDGVVDHRELRRTGFTEEDLKEAIRQHANLSEYHEVACATLERNGRISVVKK